MSSHNFTAGTPQNRQQGPLTMEEIALRAPSALATRPYNEMSAKYAYIPTVEIIQGMLKAGFQPFAASQSRTRIEGKREFTKHMLRFRHQDVAQSFAVGDVVPEIIVVNSHDGACAYKLIAGLYRLVCSNGLMVSDSEIESISVRHTGRVLQDVIEGSYRIVEDTQKSLGTVQKWSQLLLTDGEQSAFADAAHTLRFASGRKTTAITPAQLLAPRRSEDAGRDLWHVFNRVQENAIAGGLSAIQRDADGRRVRRVSTRPVNSIDADVKLNRALWQLAGKMAELKGAAPKVIDAEIVETQAA